MARPIYQRVAVTDAGDVIPGAEYTVTNENTGTEQTIYDARSGGSVISQPAFADANGVIQFWTEPGVTYRVEATGGVGTYTDRYVEADTRMTDLSDPASGSLMPPGAFGLGGKSILVTGDINILLTTGFYFVQSGGVNLPPGEVSGYLKVQSTGNVASDAAYRVWHSSSPDKMFASYRSAGAWQPWKRIDPQGFGIGERFEAWRPLNDSSGSELWVKLCEIENLPNHRWRIDLAGGKGYTSSNNDAGGATIFLTGGNNNSNANVNVSVTSEAYGGSTTLTPSEVYVKSKTGELGGDWEVWAKVGTFASLGATITASEPDSFTTFSDVTQLSKPVGTGGFERTVSAYESYTSGNILGTVSQSGGVPTGAVIERGSNTNGDYVKFADGSVLIRRKYSQLWPIGTTIVPLDLPITLLTGYDSFASWSASTAGWLRLGVSELSLSSVNLTVVMDTASTRTVSLFVIGRWF